MKSVRTAIIRLLIPTFLLLVSTQITGQNTTFTPQNSVYNLWVTSEDGGSSTAMGSESIRLSSDGMSTMTIGPEINIYSPSNPSEINVNITPDIIGDRYTKGQITLTGNALDHPNQGFQSMLKFNNLYCSECGNWEMGYSNTDILSFVYDGSERAYIDYNGVFRKNSDRKLKTKIKALESMSATFKQLKPATYKMKSGSDQDHIGFIAQDLIKNFPELVSTINHGQEKKHLVNYNGLIPIIIKVIQEQNKALKIENQNIKRRQDKLETLSIELAKLEN